MFHNEELHEGFTMHGCMYFWESMVPTYTTTKVGDSMVSFNIYSILGGIEFIGGQELFYPYILHYSAGEYYLILSESPFSTEVLIELIKEGLSVRAYAQKVKTITGAIVVKSFFEGSSINLQRTILNAMDVWGHM